MKGRSLAITLYWLRRFEFARGCLWVAWVCAWISLCVSDSVLYTYMCILHCIHVCAMCALLMAATHHRLRWKCTEPSCPQKSPQGLCIALLAPGGTKSLGSLDREKPVLPALPLVPCCFREQWCRSDTPLEVRKWSRSQTIGGTHFSHAGWAQSLAWRRGRAPKSDALTFLFSLWMPLFERFSGTFPRERRTFHLRHGWLPQATFFS